MSNMRVSELRRLKAEELMDHDLIPVAICRKIVDEWGDEVSKETVAVSLGELRKYVHNKGKPPIGSTVWSITEGIAEKPTDTNQKDPGETFMKRMMKLAGKTETIPNPYASSADRRRVPQTKTPTRRR